MRKFGLSLVGNSKLRENIVVKCQHLTKGHKLFGFYYSLIFWIGDQVKWSNVNHRSWCLIIKFSREIIIELKRGNGWVGNIFSMILVSSRSKGLLFTYVAWQQAFSLEQPLLSTKSLQISSMNIFLTFKSCKRPWIVWLNHLVVLLLAVQLQCNIYRSIVWFH